MDEQPCGCHRESTGIDSEEEPPVSRRWSSTRRSFFHVPSLSKHIPLDRHVRALAARLGTGSGYSRFVCWLCPASGWPGDVWVCAEVIDSRV
jgi:hypothetical protein